MRFKEGDYVKVRRWKDMICEFGIKRNRFIHRDEIPVSGTFLEEMKSSCRQIYCIDRVHTYTYSLRSFDERPMLYIFSDDMLEPRTYSKEEFENQRRIK